MWGFLKAIVQPIVSIVIAPYLLKKVLVTKTDKDRATIIEIMAVAAARQIVRENPDAEWAELIELMVRSLADEINFPQGSTARNRIVSAALDEVLAGAGR